MDRYWFLTWHTYGTWLPGDSRGFVGPAFDDDGERARRNEPRTALHEAKPQLTAYARGKMTGPAIHLTRPQAAAVLDQFQETARYRGWELLAVAVLTTHVHLVVGVSGDPDPTSLTRDFKAYGSRRLNRQWPRPASGTWWTESGSERILKSEARLSEVLHYVLEEQECPLVTWRPHGEQPA